MTMANLNAYEHVFPALAADIETRKTQANPDEIGWMGVSTLGKSRKSTNLGFPISPQFLLSNKTRLY